MSPKKKPLWSVDERVIVDVRNRQKRGKIVDANPRRNVLGLGSVEYLVRLDGDVRNLWVPEQNLWEES